MSAKGRLIGALIGLSAGEGLWQTGVGLLPEADPGRWRLRASSVPVETAELNGELRRSPRALDLSFYQGASPRLDRPFAEGRVDVWATVPDDGQLRIYLGEDLAQAGPVAPQRGPGGPGPAGAGPGGPPPRGPGAGPPPGGGGGPPGRPGGPPQPPAGAAPTDAASEIEAPLPAGFERGAAGMPNARARGVSSLLIDRSARRLISSPDQRCTPSSVPAPAGPELQLSVVAERAALRVLIDGAEQMVCSVGHRPGAVLLASGVRRIQLHRVEVHPAEQAPFVDGFGGAARSIGAQLGAAALGAALGALSLGGAAAWRWAAAPLLLLAPLHRLDLRGALDALRLVPVPDAMGPLTFAGPLALALLTAVAAARRGLPGGLLAASLSGVLLMIGAGGPGLGPALLGATLPAWAALVWANTHPVRARPLVSWALCAALAALGELGLRQTDAFALWSTGRGWARAQHEFAELLEIRQYKSYPSDGFPVRPPDRDPQRPRIVALGSSSTGGAYQMDDIALFWPRKLEEQLAAAGRGAWEVVNQGVGGWNSLHVRLYAESQIDRLDPDVIVVYLGHNDILTRSPAPYRELYARYRAGSSAVAAVSTALGQSRLYTGLRFSILALRDGGGAVAVPVPDARDNLSALFDLADARGARVMLVSEGLNPDPQPMAAYGQMMQGLAAERGGLYLDAAARLWETGDPDLFLDDCHLSREGHVRLAGWVGEALGAAGWLDRPPSG